jgi:hypothetical protein
MVPMPTLHRAALLGLATLLVASAARAQVEPPPAAAPPPATSPAAPVQPLSPTLAPDPTPAPTLALTERTAYEQQPPRPEPFYQKTWFWVAVAAVIATVAVILVTNSATADTQPPKTTFGNMNAF